MTKVNSAICKLRLVWLVLLSSIVIMGCSPKLDTSSKAAYDESLQKIGNSLDQTQKEQFTKVIMFYALNLHFALEPA